MVEMFQAGGVSMFFVLGLGVASVVAAVLFAVRPAEGRDRAAKAWSIAAACSVVVGTCSDFAAVGTHIPENPEWAHSPDLPLLVMTGIAESMSPGILGFSLLAVAWIVMAVGYRRLGART